MSCDVGRQLQLRFEPLAWEAPYAVEAALNIQKQKTKQNKKTHGLQKNQSEIKTVSDK